MRCWLHAGGRKHNISSLCVIIDLWFEFEGGGRLSPPRRHRGRIGPRVVVMDPDAETCNKTRAALCWCMLLVLMASWPGC